MPAHSLVFLIINYGAEMIFILYERLNAQQLSEETCRMVLNDIVKHMFSDEFLTELFRPQSLYSPAATMETFKWLAQVSAMRISSASMDKLFELMTMGVKYQIFSLRHPLELLDLTWTHLEEIERLLLPKARAYLSTFCRLLKKLSEHLTIGDLAEIRKELLNFFAGRRTLVSLFLHKGLQSQKGFFNLPQDLFLPPFDSYEPPGVIRHYKCGKLISTTMFEHRDSTLKYPLLISPGQWDPTNPLTRVSKNGTNMYFARNKQSMQGETNLRDILSEEVATHMHDSGDETKAVMEGLNKLSQLVACGKRTSRQMFKLSFFDSNYTVDKTGDEIEGICYSEKDNLELYDARNKCLINTTGKSGNYTVESSFFDSGENKKEPQQHKKMLFEIINELCAEEANVNSGKDFGGDLLDIMDED